MRRAACRRCRRRLPEGALYCPTCGTLQVLADSWSWPSLAAPRPQGWSEDPFAGTGYRYFDGDVWTDQVSATPDGRLAWQDPLPLELAFADGPGLGARGGFGLAIGGMLASFGLSNLVAFVLLVSRVPGGRLTVLPISQVLFWVALLSTCRLVSHRYGTGSFRVDFRIRIRWVDAATAVLAGILGVALAFLLTAPFVAHGSGANPDSFLGIPAQSAVAWSIIVVLACVGAPFVEEVFFRGLLQSELVRRFGSWAGVPLTALVFAACHVFNAPGRAGLVYALGVFGPGLVLGIVFDRTRRLGASMATHALYNGITLVALAVSLAHP